MIDITITGKPTGGKALLYELRGRQGRRAFVPTYHAWAAHAGMGQRFDFAVTRHSSAHVFGDGLTEPYIYAENGECPPCADTPYSGIIREDGVVGFRIALFEPQYAEQKALMGRGSILRKHVQIHFGAAAATGCILVAGRRRLYPKVFERPLRDMLAHTDQIRVMVEPR